MEHIYNTLFIKLVLSLALLPVALAAQEKDSLLLSHDYKFNEGIFLSFEQVKENTPIPKSKILTSINYSDNDFFKTLLENQRINFYDQLGSRKEIQVSRIWGYSDRGTLYIQQNGSFSRINLVGAACHFVANYTSYSTAYDPYPYSSYGTYGTRYGYYPGTQKSTEMRQYIFDFNNGKVYDFDIQGVSIVLMNDPELYDEYMSLRKKKQKQLKFFYLRKYNERNPVLMVKQ